MLNLLKRIAPFIFVKKDYIYSVVGFENTNSHLSFINKFRLEGRTVQGKNFMTSHLKQIHILFQKSIFMKCDCFKGFTVLTVRQISKSNEFQLIFYIPKLQRSFIANLTHNILSYLDHQTVEFIVQEKKVDLKEL
jgi:hypothetical protein